MLRDMATASQHVLGAIRIIQAAGGIRALGLSDLVRDLLYCYINGKGLLDLGSEQECNSIFADSGSSQFTQPKELLS